jgi:hypothetical protein
MESISQEELDIITWRARVDKAVSLLKGILLGIKADSEINAAEAKELNLWAVNNREFLSFYPFKEFIDLIEESSESPEYLKECVEDIYWLCQKYETNYYDAITADLQILQGYCHGILADGIIKDEEIHNLNKWLDSNSHLSNYYPFDEIQSLLLSILSDQIIDEHERLMLKAYLHQFADIENSEIKESIRASTEGLELMKLCTSSPDIRTDGKIFCITGVLKSGDRSELSAKICDIGGIVKPNVTKTTDYLIVGDSGNKAWAFACYGRKVERAVNLRKTGSQISIVHEFDLLDYLEDFG